MKPDRISAGAAAHAIQKAIAKEKPHDANENAEMGGKCRIALAILRALENYNRSDSASSFNKTSKNPRAKFEINNKMNLRSEK